MTSHTFTMTALAKIQKRAGVCYLVFGHPLLANTKTFFNPAMLSKFKNGDWVVVTFRSTPKGRRTLTGVQPFEFVSKDPDPRIMLEKVITKFSTDFSSTLLAEHDDIQTALGVKEFDIYTYRTIAMMNLTLKIRGALVRKGTRGSVALSLTKDGKASVLSISNEKAEEMAELYNVAMSKIIMKKESSVAEVPASTENEPEAAAAEPQSKNSRLPIVAMRTREKVGRMFTVKGNVLVFDAMVQKAKTTGAANVLFTGPSGAGKTTFASEFATQHGLDFFKMDCATIRDPEEWLGYREATADGTVFIKSQFIQAVEKGNVVILLDEFNRIESWLANTLYPLLDWTRKTVAHGEVVKVGPNVVFVAAVNLGERFIGTFQIDAALMNRFDAVIKLDYPDKASEVELVMTEVPGLTEQDANLTVELVRKVRSLQSSLELSIDVSPRTSIRIAYMLAMTNIPLMTIIDVTLLSGIQDSATEKSLVDAISSVVEGK